MWESRCRSRPVSWQGTIDAQSRRIHGAGAILPQLWVGAMVGITEPSENKRVTVSRALMSVTYPGRLTLIGIKKSCPKGRLRSDIRSECLCLYATLAVSLSMPTKDA